MIYLIYPTDSCTIFWLKNLQGRNHSEDLDVDGMATEWILGKYGGKVWTGFIWLRIGSSGRLL
jgi:hypothetical protein